MTTFKKELQRLSDSQHTIEDGTRIHSDGSIRTETVTLSGDAGWRVVAKPIPGVSPKISKFFEEGFLVVEDIRLAIDLRDQFLMAIVEEKTIRSMEQVIRNRMAKEKRDANKVPKPKRNRVPSHSSAF